MLDPSSKIYQTEIDRGLSNDIARNLKADLKAFKPRWREVMGLLDHEILLYAIDSCGSTVDLCCDETTASLQ